MPFHLAVNPPWEGGHLVGGVSQRGKMSWHACHKGRKSCGHSKKGVRENCFCSPLVKPRRYTKPARGLTPYLDNLSYSIFSTRCGSHGHDRKPSAFAIFPPVGRGCRYATAFARRPHASTVRPDARARRCAAPWPSQPFGAAPKCWKTSASVAASMTR